MLRFAIICFVALGAAFAGWYLLEWSPILSKSPIPDTSSTTASHVRNFEYRNASVNDIFVTSPEPGAYTSSVITLKGFARGTWFFEAVFPVVVEDRLGNVIGTGHGQAGADWTTTNFVPFTISIHLDNAYFGEASVVLKRDNPSGDPSRDASLSFPIVIQ